MGTSHMAGPAQGGLLLAPWIQAGCYLRLLNKLPPDPVALNGICSICRRLVVGNSGGAGLVFGLRHCWQGHRRVALGCGGAGPHAALGTGPSAFLTAQGPFAWQLAFRGSVWSSDDLQVTQGPVGHSRPLASPGSRAGEVDAAS